MIKKENRNDFAIAVETLLEMYRKGEFDVWNQETYKSHENAEKALIDGLLGYLDKYKGEE